MTDFHSLLNITIIYLKEEDIIVMFYLRTALFVWIFYSTDLVKQGLHVMVCL